MKQVYKCDFCNECFSSEQEAKQHEEKIPFILSEFERAGENNCPFMVNQYKGRALCALNVAKDIKRKREGLKTTKFEDILKQYPELVNAIEQTLGRPAWNER